MRNHSFNDLFKLSQYQEFNIRASESGLYLSLTEKRLDASSFFEDEEYALFELEDIHVTVLEQYEVSRKRADRSYKTSSPFHITLRFSEQDSGRTIVIHDFYSPLDLSRDYHVQLKDGETLTYLPQQTINLTKLNQLIDKEVSLVKELIEKNNKHEQDLRQSIDAVYDDLFSRAQEMNHFPEMMDEQNYHHFRQSLTQIIERLEQLVYLGHHHESRRLAHAKMQLDHLIKTSQSTPAVSQKGGAVAEEKVLVKAAKVSPQKPNTKKGGAQKQKNGEQLQLAQFLNAFCQEVQSLKARKNTFLKDVKIFILPEPKFEPGALFAHLNAHLGILTELTNAELEDVMMDFFKQFSNCRDPIKQTTCLEVAEFLSQNVPFFSNFMLKLSLMSFECSDVRISSILMAFLNNNMPYWAFMHSYGMSFADNRHVIVDGIAGNILHGILYLIRNIPIQSFDFIIPFVHLLFRYLDEDGVKLRNMKTITAIKMENKKKVSTSTSSRKVKSKPAEESKSSDEKFADHVREEPYGTVLIMELIEAYLYKMFSSSRGGQGAEDPHHLVCKSVDLMSLVIPHITTSALLNAFQRLLDAHVFGIFDDQSFQKLLTHTDIPTLDLFTECSLVYVGADYKEPISRLMDVFTKTLTERVSHMSNSAISNMMQFYSKLSRSELIIPPSSRRSVAHQAILHLEQNELELTRYCMLTFARIAYFLFTIKAKRGMFLTLDDFNVLLLFYHNYLLSEIMRYPNDNPENNHKRQRILAIMESAISAFSALDLPEAVKTPLLASPGFILLLSNREKFKVERDLEFVEQKTMGFAVS